MKVQIIRFIICGALAAALMVPTGTLFADSRADCEKRLDADRARIDRDASRHGEHSPAVDKDVARMENDRAWCRDHHAEWDHSKFDVGIYIKR